MQSMWRLLRGAVKWGAISYLLALASYLLLRLMFGDRLVLGFLNSFAHLLFLPLILALPALLLARSRWSLLGIVLVLVAALWFGPYFLPKATAAAATNTATLKVITFNMWGENSHLADLESWLRNSNADVILIQENHRLYAAEGSIKNLSDVYPYQFMQRWMYGNLILSKYPFVEAKDFDPTNEHGYSQQRVVIDFNGEQIAIYNIHLSMPIWTVDIPQLPFSLRMALGYNDSVRNNEIAHLIPILQAEKLPFIVGGDFNMSDHSVTYQQLANVVGDSFREVGVGMGKSWPRPVSETDAIPDWMPPIIRIDYIWHSPQWAPINAEQGPYLGSDHLAVLAQFTLK